MWLTAGWRVRGRSLGRTALRGGAAAVLLAVVCAGCAVYNLRDRHPRYELNVRLGMDGEPGTFRVGFGRRTITPEIVDRFIDVDGNAHYEPEKGDRFEDRNGNGKFDAWWLAGFGRGRPATGVHDDIWSIAAVLDDGDVRVAVVALDLIGLMYDDVIDIRSRLPDQWAIDHAVVCSTHNHEAPDVLGLWGEGFIKSGVDREYVELVKVRTVEAIGRAVAALEPATMRLVTVPDAREGLVVDTRKPEVFDADLCIMQFLRPGDGGTIGSILTWGNHPEATWSRNTEVTSDFCGYFRDGVAHGIRYGEKTVRPGVGGVHLYINGAIGGLMAPHRSLEVHDPFVEKSFREPCHEKARAVGHRLADMALDALEKHNGIANKNPSIRVRARTIRVHGSNPYFALAAMLGIVDRGFSGWPALRTEVDLVTIGDAWIVTIPGEIYPEIVNGGIENPPGADYKIDPVEVPPIREMMQGKVNFVFGLGNDEIGYIIPKSEWDNKEPYLYGSKKEVYGEINSVGAEAGPMIHRAVKELVEEARED